MSADEGPASGREVAYRLFAAEFDDADFSHSESDEERAPNYVVTPTGARVNRLFAVGVLTEIERVGEDVLRARVVDPTGAFVVYAGQYQPDAMAFLDDADPPAFVAVTGKARTFQPEDSDRVFTSVRPESVSEVDAETRDRWVVRTAEQTLRRVDAMADALDRPERGDDLRDALAAADVAEGVAAGIPLAIDHYGTTPAYLAALRTLALDAVAVVTGDRDEAGDLALAPDASGTVETDLSFAGLDEAAAGGAAEPETAVESAVEGTVAEDSGTVAGTAMASDDESTADAGSEAGAEVVEGSDAGTEDGESPEEFELPEEEREAVIEEHGVDFSSGDDIPDAGEADIETPDADAVTAEVDADAETETETETETEDADEATDDAPADLEDTVVEYMGEMGDDGVPRDDLVAAVTDDHDVTAAAVEDAVQDALMAGRCYESGDDELTPI